jgi:hypothetical protein
VEAVLRDLAERRVDADIEARDVAAPPIIRFLSRPPQSLNAHHLRACPLLQIASLVAHRSATLRLSLCLTTISLGPTTPRALEKRSSHENAGAAVYQSRPVSSETRQSHESQSHGKSHAESHAVPPQGRRTAPPGEPRGHRDRRVQGLAVNGTHGSHLMHCRPMKNVWYSLAELPEPNRPRRTRTAVRQRHGTGMLSVDYRCAFWSVKA